MRPGLAKVKAERGEAVRAGSWGMGIKKQGEEGRKLNRNRTVNRPRNNVFS